MGYRVTDCGRCGDCCENIPCSFDLATVYVARDKHMQQDLDFIREHWHPMYEVEDHTKQRFSCDAFDTDTRLCTAHEDRPPVCRDYPWYGREPDGRYIPARCSFNADYRTMLPIVEVTNHG